MNLVEFKDSNIVVEKGKLDIVGFDEIKEKLEKNLEKYKVLIDENQVKDAKKDMATLNKIKKAISDKTKQAIKAYEEEVVNFKQKTKELIGLVDDARDFLKVQVEKYENEKKKQIRQVVEEYIGAIAELNEVPKERWPNPDKYVKLSAVTQNGKITKATAAEIEKDIQLIVAQMREEELERLKKEAEIERIKKEAIEEALMKKSASQLSNHSDEEKMPQNAEKITYEVHFVYRVQGKPGKDDKAIIEAVKKLIEADMIEPEILVRRQ